MTLLGRRVIGAIAVFATLAVSACAVPGQGDPGVAATYGDRVVTNQQVVDMSQAYADLGEVPNGAGEPLTMLLLGPDLVGQAEDLGMVISDEKIQAGAEAWIAHNQKAATATPQVLDLVHDLFAVYFLLTSDAGVAALKKAGADAEAGVVASPRYGPFTNATYYATLLTAYNDVAADSSAEGVLRVVPFAQIGGFAGASPTWVSGG